MNGWDENHPIMGSAGGEPGPIISFFIGIITIIIALQRLPPVATNLFLFPPLGALGPSHLTPLCQLDALLYCTEF